MSKMQTKIYYLTLTLAVGFWVAFSVYKLQNVNVTASEEPSAESGEFQVCGLKVSAVQKNYDAGQGKYTINFNVTNTTSINQELLAKKYVCRCKEADGQSSREQGFSFDWTVCADNWPESNECKFEEETTTLTPGQTVSRSVTVTSPSGLSDPNCGSFQADWVLRRVTSSAGVMCVADQDPNVPKFQGVSLPNAYGVLFTGKSFDRQDCRLQSELKPPTCDIKTIPDPAKGEVPLSVEFDGSGSHDNDGGTLNKYEWRVDGGPVVSSADKFTHVFNAVGQHTVALRVQDNDELWSEVCLAVVDTTEPIPEKYVCDTRTQSCEMEKNVPLQFRSGACSGEGDDVVCREKEGPRFSAEPWVKHVSGQIGVYRKEVRVLRGGSVDNWQVSGVLRIVSESNVALVVEAQSGSCPAFSALVGGKLYGPYALGCLP